MRININVFVFIFENGQCTFIVSVILLYQCVISSQTCAFLLVSSIQTDNVMRRTADSV